MNPSFEVGIVLIEESTRRTHIICFEVKLLGTIIQKMGKLISVSYISEMVQMQKGIEGYL